MKNDQWLLLAVIQEPMRLFTGGGMIAKKRVEVVWEARQAARGGASAYLVTECVV